MAATELPAADSVALSREVAAYVAISQAGQEAVIAKPAGNWSPVKDSAAAKAVSENALYTAAIYTAAVPTAAFVHAAEKVGSVANSAVEALLHASNASADTAAAAVFGLGVKEPAAMLLANCLWP